MASETIGLMAMVGMFGLFLWAVWLEARRSLRHLESHDEAFVLDECEREYHRVLRDQSTQAAARARLHLLRRESAAVPARGLGMEQIGNILDRLAVQANEATREFDGASLNFVPGGARTPSNNARNSLNRAA